MVRIVWAFVVAVLWGATSPAMAQSDFDEAAENVRACFEQSGAGEAFLECVGQAANQCMIEPQGQDFAAEDCLDVELTAWRQIEQSLFAEVMAQARAFDAANPGHPASQAEALDLAKYHQGVLGDSLCRFRAMGDWATEQGREVRGLQCDLEQMIDWITVLGQLHHG